jgi:hypothetical protein
VPAGESFDIWGSGFIAGESVTVILTAPNRGGGILAREVIVNRVGAFSVSASVSGDAAGVSTIRALGSGGSAASAAINVTTGTVSPVAPGTSLVAAAVATGGDTMIWGAGFRPGEAVVVLALAAIASGDHIVIGGAANDSGAFMMEASISLDAGIYTLQATGESGSQATAPLVVSESK